MHDVEEYYGARISDPMTYLAVSMDVMARWTFPMVPDLMMDAEEGEGYVHCRKSIYKGGGIRDPIQKNIFSLSLALKNHLSFCLIFPTLREI